MRNHNIHGQIERYILGKLRQEEIEQVWLTFLEDRELYDVFITELHLRYLVMERQKKFIGCGST